MTPHLSAQGRCPNPTASAFDKTKTNTMDSSLHTSLLNAKSSGLSAPEVAPALPTRQLTPSSSQATDDTRQKRKRSCHDIDQEEEGEYLTSPTRQDSREQLNRGSRQRFTTIISSSLETTASTKPRHPIYQARATHPKFLSISLARRKATMMTLHSTCDNHTRH